MKQLVLKNKKNEIVRFFSCNADSVYLLYGKDTGRIKLSACSDLSLEDKKKNKIIKKIDIKNISQSPVLLFLGYSLEYARETQNINFSPLQIVEDTQSKDLWLSVSSVCGVFFIFITGLTIFHYLGDRVEEPVVQEQQVVKIIKPPPAIKIQKMVVASSNVYDMRPQKKVPKKVVKKSLKRLGALAALGSLSKKTSNQRGGLNLGASVSSAGPGVRSLSASSGSGGVQSSVYSKGMITAALGSGGNVKGGGGYGTKGTVAGGGKAGYGKLTLVGSGGVENLSETSQINSVVGQFDASLIDREIIKHVGKIQDCYTRALIKEPHLKGVFVSQFLINEKGRIQSPKIHKSSKIKSASMSACVLSILQRIKFDIKHDQGLLKVVYPFDLESLNQ